jgi:glycosyltransferase involved in cell wall biosynthesis
VRILLVNSFHYRRGGDSAHVLDLERLLLARGHDVAVFSMQHPSNEPSPWSDYWVRRVEFRGSESTPALVAGLRSVYSLEAKRAFARLATEFRPDVVHIHALHHHLSTSVIAQAKRMRLPVAWTLHEYRTVCPATDLLCSGRICEACAGGRFWHGIAGRCKSGSLSRSAASVVESYWSRWSGAHAAVDCYISPSRFLASLVLRMGLPARRVEVLPNFCEPLDVPEAAQVREGVVYAGRLSPEKGVDVLIDACARGGIEQVTIIGDGPSEASLRQQAGALGGAVRFTGWLGKADVWSSIARARVLCVPSIWYENCPIIVLEAMAIGTPVLASDLGGLGELLDGGNAGFLTRPGDPAALSQALGRVLASDQERLADIVTAARRRVVTRHAPAAFVERLEGVYSSLS